ncbi:heavy-metal-associated domain-containing protein [Phormidium sp. LEGE 05292]|uniref:heavy-metal-associated domain-containing protein n=1 Tax=[Phormidium] sp. LEGE 05292 TaxID=767427 RepID=UPI0018826BB9|nr:heavy-metal-associated domain-containing protein [Phormidium sp. LEGE 05292]MBE9225258.1 heavy-metal-associated domain-containing protein [Phormidium sp. LEGE 05292]
MNMELEVPSMACSACSDTITKAIKAVDPNAVVQADPKTKLVNVETEKPETAIRDAIASAGYPVT